MINSPRGVLGLSIDVASDRIRSIHAGRIEQVEAVAELVKLFDEYQIAATWSFADPSDSMDAKQVLASDVPHELALRGNAQWIGNGASRRVINRELGSRLANASRHAIKITSLILPRIAEFTQLDLIANHGIKAVRVGPPGSKNGRPRALPINRCGVLIQPAHLVFPTGQHRYFGIGGSSDFKSALKEVVARKSRIHVVVNLPALTGAKNAFRSLERKLKQIAMYRSRHQLLVETMYRSARAHSASRQSIGTRSILRSAA